MGILYYLLHAKIKWEQFIDVVTLSKQQVIKKADLICQHWHISIKPYLPTLAYKQKALFANMLVNDDRHVYEASIQIFKYTLLEKGSS